MTRMSGAILLAVLAGGSGPGIDFPIRNRDPLLDPARLILPITLTKNADLGFGQIASGGTSGSVTVTPAGGRSATGGASLGSAAGVGAAQFTVTGDLLATYSITLPGSTTLSSGGNSMTLNAFASSPSGTGNLGLLGQQTLTVGATLQVGANQPSGTYSGTFSVTVAYN